MPESIGGDDPRFVALLARAMDCLDASLTIEVGVAPIDLAPVLASFGVGEPLIEVGPRRHGGLRRVAERWHPIVYRPAPGPVRLSPRERFTVAHELAHAIIDDAVRLRPVRNSQYWALEKACDNFAGRLLVPEVEVDRARSSICGALSIVAAVEQLASTTETSLAVSARRLVHTLPNATIWGIRRLANRPETDTAYRVEWTAGLKRFGLSTRSHVKQECPLFGTAASTEGQIGARVESTTEDGIVAHARMSRNFVLIVWLGRTSERTPSKEDSQLALPL